MSVRKKLYDFAKQTLGNATPEEIAHEQALEQEASLKMAHAKKKWMIDYQTEREKKNQYIRQHVLAQSLDVGKLQKKI